MVDLSAKEKLAALRLTRSENVGPITYQRLVERFGSPSRALDALPDLAKRGGKTTFKAFAAADAEREIAQVEKYGARLIVRGEDDYPALLNEVEDAPPVLTIIGHANLLNKQALGVVGARNASLSGRKVAETFSGQVGRAGYVIASGLARGIDTAAHAASLETGTIAVVAGGIDVIYPPENKKLYEDITARGCVVAESPFSTEPIARHFPRRNRIISGLSLGVLIVEAAVKSGSLITARMALEQNREVFAVPGSPLDPRAEGTNALIKEGAHLAASADDILQVLKSLRGMALRDKPGNAWQGRADSGGDLPPDDPALRDRILENLSHTPVHMDELIRALQAPIPQILTILLELELAGRIERQRGNLVNLI